MYQVNSKVNELLANQVIDIAMLLKEFEGIINSGKCVIPQKFIDRVNSVMTYTHNLFVDYNANKVNGDFVETKLVNLMNVLLNYRNSYTPGLYGYRLFNSMYDVVKTCFIDINNI